MKCIFQVIRAETGERSEPIAHDRREFAVLLDDLAGKGTVAGDDYVLVLFDFPESSEAAISRAPLMRVSHFINVFLSVEVIENG